MLEGIDAESPVNGAVRVVAAPTLFAHVGREIVTAGGPVAGAAVVGAFVTGAALVTAAVPEVVVVVVDVSGTWEVVVAGCSTSTLPGAGQSGAAPATPKSIVVVVSGIVVVVVVVVGTTVVVDVSVATGPTVCLLYTSPSPRDS